MGRGGKNNKKKAGEPESSVAAAGNVTTATTASVSADAAAMTSFDSTNMSVSDFNRRVAPIRSEFVELSCRAALYRQREQALGAENAKIQEKYKKHFAELTSTKEQHSVQQGKLIKLDNLMKQLSERMDSTEKALEAEVQTEKVKRQEISKQFSETLSDISASLDALGKKRERVMVENIELKETLTNYLQQFDKNKGADDKLFSVEHAEQREAAERAMLEENKREDEGRMMMFEDNQVKLMTLREIEMQFQKQLIDRSSMFDTYQKRLKESNSAFFKNQGEVDELTNKIKSTEASTKALVKKLKECSPATQATLDLYNRRVQAKVQLDKNVSVYRNLKKTLEAEIAMLEKEEEVGNVGGNDTAAKS